MTSRTAPEIYGRHFNASARSFGAGTYAPSDASIDLEARKALFGTRNGKKPKTCPTCNLALLPSGECGSC